MPEFEPVVPPTTPAIPVRSIQDPKAQSAVEGMQHWVERIRDTVFQRGDEQQVGIAGLAERVKDVYTFSIGTPAVTDEDPGYAGVPLSVVADSQCVGVYVRGQKPCVGGVVLDVRLDGTILATVSIGDGADRAFVTGIANPEMRLQQQLTVVVTSAGDDPGLDDCVVQVYGR